MPGKLHKIRSVHPDGSCFLEDGREMQMVVAESGVLGLIKREKEDIVGGLDQIVGPPRAEPAPVPKNYFDLSHLDQH